MGTLLSLHRTSAEALPLTFPPVTKHDSYQDICHVTVRRIECGRFGVYTYDNVADEYIIVSAFDRRDQANAAMYQMVTASDYLVPVQTCQACWQILPLTGKRVHRGADVFCTQKCADKPKPAGMAAYLYGLGAMAMVAFLVVGFWYGMWSAAHLLFGGLR